MSEISVIVPVYNTEKYIHRCVNSILAQSFNDFELILVNDGSIDSSGEICNDYAVKDGRIRVFHQQNKGQASARNFALDWIFANSDSDYISFVDSDDWVHPHYLTLLYDAMKHCDVRISQCLYTDKGENSFLSEHEPIDNARIISITPEEQYIKYYSAVMWDKLFHRSCWETIRFPEGQIYEDVAISYKLLFSESKMALVNETLYYYTINPTSTVHSAWTPAKMAQVNAWKEQLRFFGKYGNKELLECVAVHCFQISSSQIRAIKDSSNISKKEKKHYQCEIRQLLKTIMFRYHMFKYFANHESWAFGVAFPLMIKLYRVFRDILIKS